MRPIGGFLKSVATMAAAIVAATAILIACGPWLTPFVPVTSIAPADTAAYGGGQLGVVRPRFERRYLVQAYRVLTGKPPLPASQSPVPSADPPRSLADQWPKERDA